MTLPPGRKARRNWRWYKIAAQHGLPLPPTCYRCGRLGGGKTWNDDQPFLVRAHIIDRCDGGLDGLQNIVPLCGACHGGQPEFLPGDEAEAWVWLGDDERALDWLALGVAPVATG